MGLLECVCVCVGEGVGVSGAANAVSHPPGTDWGRRPSKACKDPPDIPRGTHHLALQHKSQGWSLSDELALPFTIEPH